MIQSKEDLKRFLEMDARAMGIHRYDFRNYLWRDVWKYIWTLRVCEYFTNCGKSKILRGV